MKKQSVFSGVNLQSLTDINNATIADDNFGNNETVFELDSIPVPGAINKKKRSAFSLLGEQIKNKLNLVID